MNAAVPATTTSQDRLDEIKGMARDGLDAARQYGRDHHPELTQKVEDGLGWFQNILSDIGLDSNDLMAGSAGAALGWATGGGVSSIVMLGSLAMAAKSAFVDGDYKMAATYVGGGLAASSLLSGNIAAGAIAGAATLAMNHYWSDISNTAQDFANDPGAAINDVKQNLQQLGFGS